MVKVHFLYEVHLDFYCRGEHFVRVFSVFDHIRTYYRHPSTMAPGGFKKPLRRPSRAVRDPLPQATPWSSPGRTGITLSIPALKLNSKRPNRPLSPTRPHDKPRKDADPLLASTSSGLLSDKSLEAQASPQNVSARGDTLQKLLDGTATPAELRDAESSMFVPDEILLEAAEEYERQQNGNQLSLPMEQEDSNSLFDDDFFNTDPIWTIPNGCSTPNRSILRGGDDPPEELMDSTSIADHDISANTGSRIMQAAMNTITDGNPPPPNLSVPNAPSDMGTSQQSLDVPSPDLTTKTDTTPANKPAQSTPKSSATSSKHKRRILDFDSEDSLDTSKPHEKSRRVSDDEDGDPQKLMDSPLLAPPKYVLPTHSSGGKSTSATPALQPSVSDKTLRPLGKSKLPSLGSKGKAPLPPGSSSAASRSANPLASSQRRSPSKRSSQHGSRRPSPGRHHSHRSSSPGRSPPRHHRNSRPSSRSPPPRERHAGRPSASTSRGPDSTFNASHNQSHKSHNNSRKQQRKRKDNFRRSPPDDSGTEVPLTQPRTLEPYDRKPEDLPSLNSSTFKFEIGKLINDARYGNGRAVATSAGVLSNDDPLVQPAPEGSLFSAEDMRPASNQPSLDDSLVIKVLDIPEQVGAQMVSIKTKGVVPFVLLAKRPSDPKWSLPPLDIYDDFMNLFQCHLISADLGSFGVLDWYNKRGNVGLFGLRSEDVNKLVHVRKIITTKMMEGWIFNSYPHALAAKRYELTALLKGNLRAVELKVLPALIFLMNKNLTLQGSLECVKYKTFLRHEVSQQGESKAHWRLVVLSADEAFMLSLKAYPQHQPFLLGTGAVQIRGGERKADGKREKRSAQHPLSRGNDRGRSPDSRRTQRPTTSNRAEPNRQRPRRQSPSSTPTTKQGDAAPPPSRKKKAPAPSSASSSSSSSDGTSSSSSSSDEQEDMDVPESAHKPSKVPVFANHDRSLVITPDTTKGSVGRYAQSGSGTKLPSTNSSKKSNSKPASTERRKLKLIDRPLGDLNDKGSPLLSTSAIRSLTSGKNKNKRSLKKSDSFINV